MKFKITITGTYDVDIKRYPNCDPLEAAKIDEENLRDDPQILMSLCDTLEVFVNPAEE